MSVPPEVVARMMQGGAAAQPGPGGAPPGQSTGLPGATPAQPAAAPMPKPAEKPGLKAAAATNLQIAMNLLEEALPAFGAESKEGQKILSALKAIGTLAAHHDSSDLVPAEVLHMTRQLPQMGGGTDIQRMIMQQMARAGGGGPPQQPPGA